MLTIYKASAGSGKTYTLAYQYIKLLLAYYDPYEPEESLLDDASPLSHKEDIGASEESVTLSDEVEGENSFTRGKADEGREETTGEGSQEDSGEEKDGDSVDSKDYLPQGRWRLYSPEDRESRHRAILAVTFTHKATDEMKNRIIKELRQIISTAEGDESKWSDYTKKLIALTGCTPHELKETAEQALYDLLYDYHFFNVYTIDSFFQQVLRAFARELSKNEDFDLEIEDSMAVNMGVDSMMSSINTDNTLESKPLSKYLEDWMRSEYSSGNFSNMFNRNTSVYRALVDYVSSTLNEVFKQHSQEVVDYLREDPERFKRFRTALDKRYYQIPEDAKTKAQKTLDIYDKCDKFVQDNLSGHALGALKNFAAFKSGPSQEGFKWYDSETVKRWVGKDRSNYVTAALENPIDLFKSDYKKKTSEVPAELCEAIADTFRFVISGIIERKWINAVRGKLSHFGILVSAFEYIQQYRQDNNLILLSDTNELLKNVIADNNIPFIYEKLGNLLEHYLIDEFQDTSRLQWDNLRPMVNDSISEGNENLIIGDEKQSIYRFRNADADLLHTQAQKEIGPEKCIVRGDRPGENTNYRSAPAVVRFNNALFSYLGKKLGSMYFKNVVQDIPSQNRKKRGHVRFDVIYKDKEDKDSGSQDNRYLKIVLPRLVNDIRSLKQRGYSNGDIVILVRTRDEGATVVEHLLRQDDPTLSVSSEESLRLTMSASVKVIISALRMFVLHSEADEEAEYDEDIAMRINEILYLNSTIKDISKTIEIVATKNKDELKSFEPELSCGSTNLFTLTEKIIRDMLTEEMRKQDYAYILAFQDYVTAFCAQSSSNVRKFLRWWDINEYKLTLAASPNMDAIRVMTIHKSKGLEFKCVLMPFTDVDIKKEEELWLSGDCLKGYPNLKLTETDIPPLIRVNASSALDFKSCPFYEDYRLWLKNQETDMLNVGYVAFTRAENELIGYIKSKSDGSNEGKPVKNKAKSKSKEGDGDNDSSETSSNSKTTNIGALLEDAFQNVKTIEDVFAQDKEENVAEDAVEDIAEDAEEGLVDAVVGISTTDTGISETTEAEADAIEDDELYYCKTRQAKIPLTMPLSPYFKQVQFDSMQEYVSASEVLDYAQYAESFLRDDASDNADDSDLEDNTSDATAEAGDMTFDEGSETAVEAALQTDIESGIELDIESDIESGVEAESVPFLIGRFEYGEPTVYPALELTDEEKEAQRQKDMEKQQEELQEKDVILSSLETISIDDYEPSFSKLAEQYFIIGQDDDTCREDGGSEPVEDTSLSEEDDLPGNYGHQLWGDILHRTMSLIHDKVQAEKAIARIGRQYNMDSASFDYLRRTIWDTVALDHPRVKLWFDRRKYETVINERPIYEPSTMATYRPDRVVWYEDGSVDIIDYKFGSKYSSDYDFQMRKYIELVEGAGFTKVRGYVYFPTSGQIKEFSN